MITQVELQRGLKWLTGFRIIFSIILIFSTLVFSTNESLPFDARPFVAVYVVALLMLFISVLYGLLFKKLSTSPMFAYVQLTIDSFTVSAIIFITGGFQSIFTFLYLVVIIASSMLLLRKGSLIIATLCSLQYGLLIDLEYYGLIAPFITTGQLSAQVPWNHIIYRLVIIMAACFAVAVLSGFLAFQAKLARKELKLIEDHLKRVEKMATMGELAAGMAHEIKNPLASLSGSIQMLKEDSQPGTSNYRLMQIVLRETERLTRIVTEFLLFAKPPAFNSKQIFLALEIVETVKLFSQDILCRDNISQNVSQQDVSYAGNIKSDAGDAGQCSDQIDFKMDLDDSISVNMDPDHFRQILWNLVKNAAEAIHALKNQDAEDEPESTEVSKTFLHKAFMDNLAGTPSEDKDGVKKLSVLRGSIIIRLFRSKDNRILLKISDNGCGIDQMDIDSVFNPFFTTKSYGTGLGLSIIHRLVDSYNGLIYVESEVGQGTTFTVMFKDNVGSTSVSNLNKMLTPDSKVG
ncbi:MAG: two-component sensor histidine kinase [Desulfamplus sp.]|nr:two-component sensor histidine kinase [Desulfamplus sp.]